MTKGILTDKKGSKLSILQTLRIRGGMSRIELTRATGLSRATISTSIFELIQANLVQETNHRLSTGGRPATTLELVPHSNIMIGADFDHNSWTIGAFDLLGNLLKAIDIPVSAVTPEQTFHLLAKGIKEFVNTLDSQPIPLLGIGVPGLVDATHSIITSAAQLDWFNVNVIKLLREEIDWPVVVLNRFRARGLAECRYGSGEKFNHLIYIGISSGVASGIYINRQLVSGAKGGAGELGHTTVEPDGPICHCGNQGCLQMLTSGFSIEQEFRRLLRAGSHSTIFTNPSIDLQSVKALDICAAADQGDELAAKVIKKAANYMGIAMANLVNIFNPEAVILGGPIPSHCKLYVDTANKVMHQRAMTALSTDTLVKTASFKKYGGALGAVNFALDRNLDMSMLYPDVGDSKPPLQFHSTGK